MFLQFLQPQQIHQSDAHEQGVIEDIVILHGQIEILHGGQWQMLKTGDSLRFAADQPHGYRNLTNLEATFHNIMHYPSKCWCFRWFIDKKLPKLFTCPPFVWFITGTMIEF